VERVINYLLLSNIEYIPMLDWIILLVMYKIIVILVPITTKYLV